MQTLGPDQILRILRQKENAHFKCLKKILAHRRTAVWYSLYCCIALGPATDILYL